MIKQITAREADLPTTEYWYLHWWSQNFSKYVYAYRETNRQKYFLEKREGTWKVFENHRSGSKPVPQTEGFSHVGVDITHIIGTYNWLWFLLFFGVVCLIFFYVIKIAGYF